MPLKIYRDNIIKICILIFITTTPTYSQTTYVLPLDSLFKLGIENSLKIQNSKIDVDIANNDINDKKGYRLPDINIGVNGGYIGEPTIFQHGLSDPKHSDMPSWSQNYNVGLSQPLYQGGRIKNSIDKAYLQKEIATLNVKSNQAEIKLLLINRYLDLLRLFKQEEVIEKSIAQSKSQLHDIKEMAKNGMITNSDVLRSELQLSSYELSLSETKNDIIIISQEIDIALALNEDLILIPESSLLDKTFFIMSYDRYIEMAYRNYPELKISQSYVALAKNNIKLVKSDYLPSFSLKAGNTLSRPITSTSPAKDLYANNWNISLSISYNLASLYHNRWKVNIAKQVVDQQNIEMQKTMQNIRTNVKASFIKHNEALERIKTLTISVKQAEENYRIVLNKYKNHIAILTDLLDASSLQLEAELQLTTAKTNAVYTYYQLLCSSGNL
ncbi:MAG: TolC family protein [Rikenellaceae bacterium]